ncbi:MAG: IS110 family RNA-guided transposase [Planctomycetota bacterium]|jgi:transposase
MRKGTQQDDVAAIGVDISDRKSHLAVIDERCEVVERTQLATTEVAFRRYFESRASTRVALEASTHSPWISRVLKDCGHEVIVANPRKLELISKNDSKNDRKDAELLARLARADPKLLRPVQHRGEQAQLDLSLIRARDTLVRMRASLVNFARGTVKTAGARLSKCDTKTFATRVKDEIPKGLRRTLAPILRQLKQLTKEIAGYDKRIDAVSAKRYPETALLKQVHGVGPITALCFVLTIEDPARFRKSRTVGAFLGLRPRQCDSGDSEPELRITKAGSSELRRLLVQAAHHILGPFGIDSDLRRHGQRIASRGAKIAKKKAVVAVARKLAVLLHRLWVTAEAYEPLRNSRNTLAAA